MLNAGDDCQTFCGRRKTEIACLGGAVDHHESKISIITFNLQPDRPRRKK